MKSLIIAIVATASVFATFENANAQLFRFCWRCSATNACAPMTRVEPCAPVAPCSPAETRAQTETRGREYVPGVAAEQLARTDGSAFLTAANSFRARFGLRPLVASSALETNAQVQASLCSRWGALIHARGAMEILAQNGQGFETALTQWYNSPSHRAILLSPSVQYAGIGFVRDSYGRVWVSMQFE